MNVTELETWLYGTHILTDLRGEGQCCESGVGGAGVVVWVEVGKGGENEEHL